MRLLGNIIWFLFGGLWAFFGYAIGAIGLFLTIIGIPFGIQAWKLAVASLVPFGKEVRARPEADTPLRVIFNVLWIIFFGWEIALGHIVFGALLAITIVGIPFAQQHFKLLPLSLLPFGRDLVAAASQPPAAAA